MACNAQSESRGLGIDGSGLEVGMIMGNDYPQDSFERFLFGGFHDTSS